MHRVLGGSACWAPVLLTIGLCVGTAHAAVTGTVNPATVHGSDFTWTCDVNPGRSQRNIRRDPARFAVLDDPAVASERGTGADHVAGAADPQVGYGRQQALHGVGELLLGARHRLDVDQGPGELDRVGGELGGERG